MTGKPTPEPLPHLAIDREPDLAYRRRPPQPFWSSSSRSDRTHHAGDTARLADQAKSEISAIRTQSGIDPSRLLVLEFTTVDRTAREEIESRLSATVVNERIQQRGVTSHLVSSADIDEATLPAGARVRRAQVGDITASHNASAAQISKDLNPKEHVVVEVPQNPTSESPPRLRRGQKTRSCSASRFSSTPSANWNDFAARSMHTDVARKQLRSCQR